MNWPAKSGGAMKIETALLVVVIVQLSIAALNLGIHRILKWEADLARLPLLVYEVFRVHQWFISCILVIFGVMTLRFRHEMASGGSAPCAWLAACIGCFWLFRTFLQVAYYSSSHWRGKAGLTVIHVTCILVYGGMSLVYLVAAWKGGGG